MQKLRLWGNQPHWFSDKFGEKPNQLNHAHPTKHPCKRTLNVAFHGFSPSHIYNLDV